MDAFESVKQCGNDLLFSLHEFDPPISPVQYHKSTSGLDGGQIIQLVLDSARIKNAVVEVSGAEKFYELSEGFYSEVFSPDCRYLITLLHK
jgi:hypothetical protein